MKAFIALMSIMLVGSLSLSALADQANPASIQNQIFLLTGKTDLVPPPVDPERTEIKSVDRRFVSDASNEMAQYKKKYGGGNYVVEKVTDKNRDFSTYGISPSFDMTSCSKLYVASLVTKGKEVQSRYYYCVGTSDIKLLNAYSLKRNVWSKLR